VTPTITFFQEFKDTDKISIYLEEEKGCIQTWSGGKAYDLRY
jgi:hypothetical protein